MTEPVYIGENVTLYLGGTRVSAQSAPCHDSFPCNRSNNAPESRRQKTLHNADISLLGRGYWHTADINNRRRRRAVSLLCWDCTISQYHILCSGEVARPHVDGYGPCALQSQGSLGGYPAYPHLCGERSHSTVGADQVPVPLSPDAHTYRHHPPISQTIKAHTHYVSSCRCDSSDSLGRYDASCSLFTSNRDYNTLSKGSQWH